MGPDTGKNKSTQTKLRELQNELSQARSRIDPLVVEGKLTGDLRPAQQALEELQLKTSLYETLCQEHVMQTRAILGANFLGVEEWRRGFEVEVGRPPPIPDWISKELLDGDCQLHPGKKVKESHMLVLVPRTVNGELYSPLKLAELCKGRPGTIFAGVEWADQWRSEAWAQEAASESEWILIPKSDPDPDRVPEDRHFRAKTIGQQDEVYKCYAKDYAEASALQEMTKVLLNSVVDGEQLLARFYLRTREPNSFGGRTTLGSCKVKSWMVYIVPGIDLASRLIGRALVRK